MFEPVETPLDDTKFAYLESLSWEKGDVVIRISQGDRRLGLVFRGVVGMAFKSDLFGTNGGQITRDDAVPLPASILACSESSATLEHIRSMPDAFRDVTEDLVHYQLSLREHAVSVVSEGQVEFESTENVARLSGRACRGSP